MPAQRAPPLFSRSIPKGLPLACSLDFETRSTVDLKVTGVYPYAKHASTGIWCMAYAFDEEEPELWVMGQPFPERLREYIATGAELRAWNAAFERIMWRDCARRIFPDWPEVQDRQWVCTAAEAAAMSLPRSLDECARVVGVQQQKDAAGYRLMLQMCRPRKVLEDGTIVWWDTPDRLERLHPYCKQDVRTERSLARVLRRLTPQERELYLLDQRINDRGVRLDRELVVQAKEMVGHALKKANAEVRALTRSKVDAVSQVGRLLTWLRGEGLEVDSVAKRPLADLLATDLQPHVRAALEARQEAGKSSVAKLESMLEVADPEDDRMRGLLLYHGANTGRWSGRLVQPQNFPRGEIDDIERYIEYVRTQSFDLLNCLQSPMTVISSMLRSMIVASPGHRLMSGDFTAIEARVLNWLAGQTDITSQFAAGVDIYKANARRIYKLAPDEVVTKAQRQTGKFQELGCGFGMGKVKAVSAAKSVYGVELTEKEAEDIVAEYRARHPKVVNYWYDCEQAAFDAVREPGKPFYVGKCRFVVKGKYLWLVLPSGRPLCYAAPKLAERETPWGEMRLAVVAWSVNSVTRKWESRAMYGGLWVENIVQAVSRDLMAERMPVLEAAGYPLILTVHDELVADVPLGHGTLEDFNRIIAETPSWAAGCPVAAEAWEGERYRK